MSTFLARIGADRERQLRSIGTLRHFDRGDSLFHERQLGETIAVVLSGRVKLTTLTAEGKEVVLALRGPGELLGEQSAIDGKPRSASATALDRVEALLVASPAFRAYLAEHPDVALGLLAMLSAKLRDADLKRAEHLAQDTVGRVAARLVELAERFGERRDDGSVGVELPITQEELAGWSSASVESVGKALATLRAPGWIETGRRRVTILDMKAVRSRAA